MLCARMSSGAHGFPLLASEPPTTHTPYHLPWGGGTVGQDFAPLGCVIIIRHHSWVRAGAVLGAEGV